MTSNSALYVLGAAVIGIVGAAGMFIVEHFRQERRRHSMVRELARLDRQVCGLQSELEQLRTQKLSKERFRKKHNLHKVSSSSTLSTRSYDSVNEADSSDLEFYDLSDDESTQSTITPLEQILQEIDLNLNSGDAAKVKNAYENLSELNLKYPRDSEILWHFGKACYKMIATVSDPVVKQEFITKGIEMCESSIELNPKVADAHKWCAILIGMRSNTQSIQGKISDGYLFKQHIDTAIGLKAGDPTLHHMLGRFTYESANLKWYERKVAATFFAEPPNGTFDEALEHFQLAENLMGADWKENKLLIGKCLIALGRYKEAVKALGTANTMVDNSLDDEVDSEVKVLLQKYNSYR
uniref:Regulator of microtubule dynamics protein 1 n=1 Tax=Photinus pyralis TaxID=7054 RepID=A0A1Y1KI55_PHOPY